MSFYASTHTHLKSVFDADVNLTKYCQLIKKMGGQGFVLTDHGVLSAIEDAKEAADAEGIKFVPGVEAYIEEDDALLKRQHLILIANIIIQKNFSAVRLTGQIRLKISVH